MASRHPGYQDNHDDEPWLRHGEQKGRRRVVRRFAGDPAQRGAETAAPDSQNLDERLRDLEMRLTAEQRHQTRDRNVERFRESTGKSRHRRAWGPILTTIGVILAVAAISYAILRTGRKAADADEPTPVSQIGIDFLDTGSPLEEAAAASASNVAVDTEPLPTFVPTPIDPSEIPDRIPTSDPSMSEIRETISSFLRTDSVEAKRRHLAPGARLGTLLERYRGHEMLMARPPDNFGRYCYRKKDGSLILAEVYLGPTRGYRPIVLENVEGMYLIDFPSFIGHNEFDWTDVPRLAQGGPITVRALARGNRDYPPPRPGDLVLELRDPDQIHGVFAAASVVAIGEDYIIEGLKIGVPLPVTVKLTTDTAQSGSPYLRIEKLITPGWYVGPNGETIRIPDQRLLNQDAPSP